ISEDLRARLVGRSAAMWRVNAHAWLGDVLAALEGCRVMGTDGGASVFGLGEVFAEAAGHPYQFSAVRHQGMHPEVQQESRLGLGEIHEASARRWEAMPSGWSLRTSRRSRVVPCCSQMVDAMRRASPLCCSQQASWNMSRREQKARIS